MRSLFRKMRQGIHHKVVAQEPGLYITLIFPIAVSFLITFAGSRIIGYLITYGYVPEIYLQPSQGVHIHHYTYGFFILAAAGYLALVFSGPRAKYGIALLLGFGLGLAFDEFGMWLKLRDDEITRWSYDGFNMVIGVFFLLLSARGGVRLLKRLLRGQFRS